MDTCILDNDLLKFQRDNKQGTQTAAELAEYVGTFLNSTTTEAVLASGDLGPAGTVVKTENFTYEVAESNATDFHITTLGGVKLYYRPSNNIAYVAALGNNEAAAQAVLDNFPSYVISFPTAGLIDIVAGLVTNTEQTLLGNNCRLTSSSTEVNGITIPSNTSGVTIENFWIQPLENINGFDRGVWVRDATNWVIRNNTIIGVGSETNPNGSNSEDYALWERGWGIMVHGTTNSADNCYNGLITQNTIKDVKGRGVLRGDSIYISGCKHINVTNNYCELSRRQGIAVTSYAENINIEGNTILDTYLAGIDIEPDHPNTTNTIRITNNSIIGYGLKPLDFVGSQFFGIDLHSNIWSDGIVSGNYIEATVIQAEEAIRAQNVSSNVIITDNIINLNGFSAVGMFLNAGNGFKNMTISNNRITGFTETGVKGYNNGDVTFTSNYLESAELSVVVGVQLTEATSLVVSDNIVVCNNSPSTFTSYLVRNGKSVTITGNVSVQGQGDGIYLYANTDAVTAALSNNSFVAVSGNSAYKIDAANVGTFTDLAFGFNAAAGFTSKVSSLNNAPAVSSDNKTITRATLINFGSIPEDVHRVTGPLFMNGVLLSDADKWSISVILPSNAPEGLLIKRGEVVSDNNVRFLMTSLTGAGTSEATNLAGCRIIATKVD